MIRTLLKKLYQMKGTKVLAWILFGVASIALIAFTWQFDFEQLLKSLPFDADPSAPWYRGAIGFTLLSTLAICVSCPRQAVSFVAGFFFEIWTGFFVALIAASISCAITYGLSVLMREWAQKFVKGRISIAVDFWQQNTFMATLVWRFIPAGSNLLTNIAAGALSIPATRFVFGSSVGYIPHTLVFAGLGSGIQLQSGTQIAYSVALFAIALAVGFILVSRYRSKLKRDPISRA